MTDLDIDIDIKDDMLNLLVQWNLGEYWNIFNENGITIEILPLLGESEIKELFPKIGPRLVFSKHLDLYKKYLDQTTDEINSTTSNYEKTPVCSYELATPSSEVRTFEPEPKIKINDLEEILKKSMEGRSLLSLRKDEPLTNSARLRLVRIVSTNIIQNNINEIIRSTTYDNWAKQIVSMFPREQYAVYFHTKTVNSTRGVISRMGGKLPDRVHNLKRSYRANGVLPKVSRRTTSPGEICTSSDL